MKAITALPTPALPRKPRVKNLLIKGIYYLVSEKFLTFVGAMAVLWSWWGACTDDNHAIAYGAAVWLAAFISWLWQQTAGNLKQNNKAKL